MPNATVFVDGENILSGNEKTQENAEIVIVTSHETHIWIHGTHYTTVGEVTDSNDVSPGDLFHSSAGGHMIEQVLSINQSSGEDKPTFDCGLVYFGALGKINAVAEPPYSNTDSDMDVQQGMTIGHFTGYGKDAAMGYTGPPVKLEKVETDLTGSE